MKMDKINTYAELQERYQALRHLLGLRVKEEGHKGEFERDILVCGGTGCIASASNEIVANLNAALAANGLAKKVQVLKTGCFGFCEKGPIVLVQPDHIFYVQVKPEDAKAIVEQHIIGGKPVESLQYMEPITQKRIPQSNEMPFYKKQMRIALRNCGLINPERVAEYLAAQGWQALGKVLTEYSREQVVDIMLKSGLRGRGGAGFPTGLKWQAAMKAEGEEKYIVCNADEGDPGAFMDRSIMEGDPCSVLEAMAIAGYCVGAEQGVIYIRAEYPLAIQRLEKAIGQSRELGLLGKNIMGTGFNFDVRIQLGAGAFVCGEETALLRSIEGMRGEPTTKPPFPAEKGMWDMPTCVNNVETLANIPPIILKGADWYSSIGTEKSKGTKVFALAGKINNVGLVEVPMGTTLREVIFDIGGGIRGGGEFKAVQTGGPSGGCMTKEHLDTPITYENLQAVGSMMGSGGMIVMDESTCMVDIAKFYLEFTLEESCGKCTPCRIGNKRLHEILETITEGKAEENAIEKLEVLGEVIKKTSLCGLGQTSPNPVLSTIHFFREEYEAHIKDHKCPAGVCKNLKQYHVIADKCIGCTACARNCPATCISGKVKEVHEIDQSKCIKCGVCMTKCKFGAIEIR